MRFPASVRSSCSPPTGPLPPLSRWSNNWISFRNCVGAEPPLSRWSNNWISFRNCVFMADATMQGDKPDQTLWIKSASSTIFEKCTFMAAGAVAIKLGADSDADPDTGAATFADGLCSITEIRDSWIAGDIVREKSYNLSLRNNQLSVRGDAPENSRLRISGGGIALNETIDNCLWDPTGVSDWDGILIEGGKHPETSGNLRISNSQLVGRRELIRIHRGTAVIECNRPVASGRLRECFCHDRPPCESVMMRANETGQYVSVNEAGAIKSTLLKDERTQPLPFLPPKTPILSLSPVLGIRRTGRGLPLVEQRLRSGLKTRRKFVENGFMSLTV